MKQSFTFLVNLCLCVSVALAGTKLCPSQFSGYYLENRAQKINGLLKDEYYLVLCVDGKYIYEKGFETIPWTIPFDFGGKPLVLARVKEYALQSVPVFLPEALIGGIFEVISHPGLANGTISTLPLAALVSSYISQYWLEIQRSSVLYHIPLLHTPSPQESGWHNDIKVNEGYNYTTERKHRAKLATDLVSKTLPDNFISLINVQKQLSMDNFNRFVSHLHKLF